MSVNIGVGPSGPSPWNGDYSNLASQSLEYSANAYLASQNQLFTPIEYFYHPAQTVYHPLTYLQQFQPCQPTDYGNLQSLVPNPVSLPPVTTFLKVADVGNRSSNAVPDGFSPVTSMESSRLAQSRLEGNGQANYHSSLDIPQYQHHDPSIHPSLDKQNLTSSSAEPYSEAIPAAPYPTSLPYVIVSHERIHLSTSTTSPAFSTSASSTVPQHPFPPSSQAVRDDRTCTSIPTTGGQRQVTPIFEFANETLQLSSEGKKQVSCLGIRHS
jgi:hypothetical protein